MLAKEEVITTRVTLGAFFLMAERTPFVPFMAGARRAFLVSVTLKWKGEAVSGREGVSKCWIEFGQSMSSERFKPP